MKTYRVSTHVQRLADCLVANGKPFCFDGAVIEFTASERFIKAVCKECMFLTAEDFVELSNNK